jgi:hypothetical protein
MMVLSSATSGRPVCRAFMTSDEKERGRGRMAAFLYYGRLSLAHFAQGETREAAFAASLYRLAADAYGKRQDP